MNECELQAMQQRSEVADEQNELVARACDEEKRVQQRREDLPT